MLRLVKILRRISTDRYTIHKHSKKKENKWVAQHCGDELSLWGGSPNFTLIDVAKSKYNTMQCNTIHYDTIQYNIAQGTKLNISRTVILK